MYDFCSEELKQQLAGPREAIKAEEDRKANQDRAAKKAKMVQHYPTALHLLQVCLRHSGSMMFLMLGVMFAASSPSMSRVVLTCKHKESACHTSNYTIFCIWSC